MFDTIAYFKNKSTLLLGFDSIFRFSQKTGFSELDQYTESNKGSFIVTAISYDLKNHIEALESRHFDPHFFPELICWTPSYVIRLSESGELLFEKGVLSPKVYDFAISWFFPSKKEEVKLQFIPDINKFDYIGRVLKIQHEIQRGNCYELNFCQNFTAKEIDLIESPSFFNDLYAHTESPQSVYIQVDGVEVFCMSPERFIQRKDSVLISQPIKGTIRRGESKEEDAFLRDKLLNDPKEISENIMIVDLVRNDLAKIAEKKSVRVDELCVLNTFKTLHHLISTVSCEIDEEKTVSELLKALFPMGSMTGAPKVSVMKLIDSFESFKRGIFSGSIGLIEPNGDFDFNVVIRTIVYTKANKIMTCSVGSAITIASNPEKEYEECFVKLNRLISF